MATPSLNTGSSIVDYLKSTGQDSGFSTRTNLAKQYGINNYSGTADQNTQLLQALKGGTGSRSLTSTPPVATNTPQVTTSTPTVNRDLSENPLQNNSTRIIEGVPTGQNVQQPMSREALFNQTIQAMLKAAQGSGNEDLMAKRNAIINARFNAVNQSTPENLRVLSPNAQANLRGLDARGLESQLGGVDAAIKSRQEQDARQLQASNMLFDALYKQQTLENDSKGEGFTLTPGQTRYDSEGNVIATIAEGTNLSPKDQLELQKLQLEIQKATYDLANSTSELDYKLKLAELEKKQSELTNKSDPSVLANEALTALTDLEGHPGLTSAVGFKILPWAVPGTDRAGFDAQLQRVKSLLTLPNLQYLKGLGAMSDREFTTIQSAVAALDTKMNETEFKTELERIKTSLQSTVNSAGGSTGTQNPQQLQGGYEQLQKKLNITTSYEDAIKKYGEAGLKQILEKNGITFNKPLSTGLNGSDVKKVAAAIGQYESGGNYNALGPVVTSGQYAGERALGKYQVMPGNVASWTKEALGYSMTPQQFLKDPKAQDAVAEHRMGKLLAQYGNVEDVASVWFSGRPVARAGNAKDVLGTSVPQYIKNVRSIYDRLS